jgi:hypothetical protein
VTGAAPHLRRLAAALASVGAAAALGACGLGAGATPTDTRLVITRDFGQRDVKTVDDPKSAGSDTVMRLLQRNAEVKTRYGGGFVQSIDGLKGGRSDGRATDWFFYVNGIQSREGATSFKVRSGDHVWWDHHAWEGAAESTAIVGGFPEPFVHGVEGERLPVRLECADLEGAICNTVRDRLTAVGVVAGKGGIQRSLAKETIRVVVGLWSEIRGEGTVQRLEAGPGESGVFARPARDGRSIGLMGTDGQLERTLRAGAGLVAAQRIEDAPPVWIVTGTDDAGLRAAASALDEATLHNAFAYAVSKDTGGLAVPSRPATAGS